MNRLCTLSASEITRFARAWAKTEELSGLESQFPGIAAEVLENIVNLARRGRQVGKNLFLWEAL